MENQMIEVLDASLQSSNHNERDIAQVRETQRNDSEAPVEEEINEL